MRMGSCNQQVGKNTLSTAYLQSWHLKSVSKCKWKVMQRYSTYQFHQLSTTPSTMPSSTTKNPTIKFCLWLKSPSMVKKAFPIHNWRKNFIKRINLIWLASSAQCLNNPLYIILLNLNPSVGSWLVLTPQKSFISACRFKTSKGI